MPAPTSISPSRSFRCITPAATWAIPEAATTKAKRRRKARSARPADGRRATAARAAPARAGLALPASVSLATLAARHGGALDPGLGRAIVDHVAPIDAAGDGDLAPLLSRRYLARAKDTRAVVLADEALAHLVPVGRR